MRIPFQNQIQQARAKAKTRQQTVQPTPDVSRIQRELDYAKRLGRQNRKLAQLRKRIAERSRRSYGRQTKQ